MGDAARPALYLIKNDGPVQHRPRSVNKGSAIVLEAERGELRDSVLRILSNEDARALLTGLAMTIIQVLHAQQTL
jgi:hypothetical protein